MSIPPLVCSTPPPPEQCEDDKDPDDFDLNYNLSQEDDNADYDYGNFSNFNHFQSTTSDSCPDINKQQAVNSLKAKSDDTILTNRDQVLQEDVQLNSLDNEVIEDLDLKINHEDTVESSKSNKESDSNISEHSIKDLNTDIPLTSAVTQDEVALTRSNLETVTLNCNEKSEVVTKHKIDQKVDDIISDISRNDEANVTAVSNLNIDVDEESIVDSKPQLTKNDSIPGKIDNNPDEFEDFDDFQFISVNNKPDIIIDTSENPWENETPQNTAFGDFTANFESNEEPSILRSDEQLVQEDNEPDDDFGDFDEFKSVNKAMSNTPPPDRTPWEEVPVFNLQSADSEHQIIERINGVMHSIFQQSIEESDSIFKSKLECSLGETWGHLLETDVRQPYIVNWNNSLAQKTLLRALCIDSRNILFGPKWSSSMPKYAANLSTAPLQPQKQLGQSNMSQSDAVHPDKSTNKTWMDPFTSDGQEFTYAEALLLDLEHLMATLDQMAHNHSTLKISELLSHACSTGNENVAMEPGPTDLDVFEASVSTKTDKIYSNTLSIQPLRQINLPDTHIFTPTDSETPRSKTIHYDNRSAGLIPKPDNISPQTHNLENDNDYWEFQDFRGATQSNDISSAINEEPKTKVINTEISNEQKPNYSIETQVLQPVKLDLVMPTLNWPNPGEVKETFDDFTDFMSNSSSHDDNQESLSQSSNISTKLVNEPPKSINEAFDSSDKPDDDFEMFQSAVPPFKNNSQAGFINTNTIQDNVSAVGATNISDFDAVFVTADMNKSENISLPFTKPIENAIKILDDIPKMNEIVFSSPKIPSATVPISNVLQPTIATPSGTKQSQQKMGQILQPLSLESYSQINWPNPGINLQDLSKFNPVETLQSFKSETSSQSKNASPVHSQKVFNNNQTADDDIWGEFVSSKPKQQIQPKKPATFADDDEWTDFVSSPSVNPHNGLNTISLNVHTNSSMQKSCNSTKYQTKEIPLDIPSLNYITPKTTNQTSYTERHFQNL